MMCMNCYAVLDLSQKGIRVMRKTAPFYRCSKCNTKHAQLYREFGQWPIPGWEELLEKFTANVVYRVVL